jgi:hypothetical protein
MGGDDTVTINGQEYDADDVERVLRDYGYDMWDLEHDLIDEEELERILDDLN